jgi:hypothetical protein
MDKIFQEQLKTLRDPDSKLEALTYHYQGTQYVIVSHNRGYVWGGWTKLFETREPTGQALALDNQWAILADWLEEHEEAWVNLIPYVETNNG